MASKNNKRESATIEEITRQAAKSFSKESFKILKEIEKKNEAQRKLIENRGKAKTKEARDQIDEIIDENTRKIKELMDEYNSGVASFWEEWTDQERDAFAERSGMLDDAVRDTEEAIDKIRGRLRSSIEEVSEEVEDSLDEFEDSFSDRMSHIADQLREWSNALNLTALVDSTRESIDSYMDNIRQMRVATGSWFDEKGFSQATSDLVQKTWSYNRAESSEFIATLMNDFGLKQMEQTAQYSSELAAATKAFNNSISDYENILWRDTNENYNGRLLRSINNIAGTLEDDQYLNVKADGIISKINENIDSIIGLHADDEKKQKGLIKSVAAIEAIQQSAATEGMGTLSEKMTEWSRMSIPELQEDENFLQYQALTGINAKDFYDMASSGKEEDLQKLYLSLYDSLNAIGGDNEYARQYNLHQWTQALGFSDYADLNSLLTMDRDKIADYIHKSSEDVDKALKSSGSTATEKENESVTKYENLLNDFSDNKVARKLSDFFGEFDIKTANLANMTIVASGGISAAKSLFKGFRGFKNGKGIGRLGGFFKGLFGFGDDATKAVASAEKAAGKAGFFGKMKNFFKFGSKNADDLAKASGKAGFFGKMKNFFRFGSRNVDDVAKAAGKGTGFLSKLKGLFSGGSGLAKGTGIISKIGTFLKNSKLASLAGKAGNIGKIAGKASGPIAALFAIFDGIGGVKLSKKWTGNKKLSSKVSSFFAGILGGTGPGIGEKGSAGSKFLNILGGAGKGAALGAALGTIFPGIGNLIGAGVGAIVGAITHAIGGKRIAKFFKFIGGKIAGAASKAKDFIVTAWKSVSAVVSKITGKLKEVWDRFSESVNAWRDKLASSFKTLTDWFESTRIGGWLSKRFSAKGMGKGAAAGAVVGSSIPGVGTLVGAGIGAVVGGKKSKKDKVKGYAKGLSEVPFDNFPAFLHKGESVLTEKQSKMLKKADGGLKLNGFENYDKLNSLLTADRKDIAKYIGGRSSKLEKQVDKISSWTDSMGISNYDELNSILTTDRKEISDYIHKASDSVSGLGDTDISKFKGMSITELMKNKDFLKYQAMTGTSAKEFYDKFSSSDKLNKAMESFTKLKSITSMDKYEFGKMLEDIIRRSSSSGILSELGGSGSLFGIVKDLKNKITGRFLKEDKDMSRLIRDFNDNGLLGNAFQGGASGVLAKLTEGIFGSSGLGKDIANLISGKGTGGSLMTRLKQIFGDDKKSNSGGAATSSAGSAAGSGDSDGSGATASGSTSGLKPLAFHPNIKGSGAERWRPYTIDALKANKLDSGKAMQDKVVKQIKSESGGDPKAVNNWDSNAAKGDPSKGLLQVIGSTFKAHKFKNHGDIWNGYDNMLAAIHYAKGRYGKTLMDKNGNGIGSGKGYAVGTPFVPNDQVALIHQGEMIVPADQNPMNNPTTTVSVGRATGSGDNTQVIETMKWQVSRLEGKLDRLISAVESKGNKRRMPREASDELNEAFSSVKRPGMGVL